MIDKADVRVRTALVLSAGGMFGAYQAGAWKALEKTFTPDIVVGASVGALNGWLIASGCSGDELTERWLHHSAGNALRLFPQPGWRNGWFDPAPLRVQAEQLIQEWRPKKEFGLVVVQIPRLRTVLVRYPDVTAAHLQATCSIPYFLPSVEINGKRFVDGGFFEKLPIWAAAEMGATRIVAVDCLPSFGNWWLRAGIGVAKLIAPSRRLPPNLDITIVEPSERMGTANDAVFWKKENVERWARLGEKDALQAGC